MTWFTETPWPPIVICSMAAVLLIAAWYPNRRGVYLCGAGGLVVVSVAIWFVERQIVTESERVEAAVYGVTSAFQRNDRAATLDYFSPQVVFLRQLVSLALKYYDVQDDMRITDLHVTMKANDTLAISHFRANATVVSERLGDLGYRSSRWEVTWRKEADDWKITEVRRLDPITGEVIDPVPRVEQ